jgi:Kdo2-lipid IVA lauroyltransferase/acyltransferase
MSTMLPAATPDKEPLSHDPATAPTARQAWWVRLLSALPFPVLYGIADLMAWLSFNVVKYRANVVRDNLALAFPHLNEAGLREIERLYYVGFAQVLVEVIKAASLAPKQLQRRVHILNLEGPRAHLAQGRSVLLVAAHQCNWEWMLLALTLELGYPVDAAYKPLVDSWAEREMKKLRTRFGSRLIPAKELLADIIKRGKVARAIAMVADQEPTTSEHKHWTRFLNRDSAFYMGPEEISRVTRFPVFFVSMRRTGRGHYVIDVQALNGDPEQPAGSLTERYARRVEEQIHAAPPDWPWSHKRWRLKKSVYERD